MFKKQKCIYIYADNSIFNLETVIKFENLSTLDSAFLFSNLLANYFELTSQLTKEAEIIFCIDVKDNDFIPQNFFPANSKIFFATSGNIVYNMEVLDQNYFSLFENNIFFRSDAIGVSDQNINKIFDLLSIEDNSLVIGRSIKNKIPFIGFNSVDRELMIKLFEVQFDYEKFLLEAGKRELFINTVDGFQIIENFDDLKKLYTELSKKESETYCSQESHERFTNLFIEYRDLLR